jgi:hypothetical protein
LLIGPIVAGICKLGFSPFQNTMEQRARSSGTVVTYWGVGGWLAVKFRNHLRISKKYQLLPGAKCGNF